MYATWNQRKMLRLFIPSLLMVLANTLPAYCQSKSDEKTAAQDRPAIQDRPVAQEHPSALWGRAEYLYWWPQGQQVPPLVTSSPVGTPRQAAGVLGQPGTTILFGDSREGTDPLSGGRFTLGYWLDCAHTIGVEANFFFLQNGTFGFNDASNGDRIIARPFFDANPAVNAPASELVSYPGSFAGAINVSGSSSLLGAEALINSCLGCQCCDCGCWGRCCMWKTDLLAGYRYLSLHDRIGIHEDITSINQKDPFIVPGTRFIVDDSFSTQNNFHGGELGLRAEGFTGPWSVRGVAKVALGVTEQNVAIDGSSSVTVPGLAPVVSTGGLLAQPTNIGHYTRTVFAVVPEVDVALGYKLTKNLRATVGYTFIWWNSVARAGDHIDTTVNSSQIGGTPLTGPARPQFNFHDTDFWVHGLTVGLDWTF
jgi:Putative beta barrel porin-7 (BBP7)